ncbi:MAG: GntR family transcriptional regulator [Pseudomonadales bacterium]|nr:GntR family transcriptional regulator [Pseudomonadales bacterium]
MGTATSLIDRIFGGPDAISRESRPLYMQLQKRIREAVAEGILKSGDTIPPEREIAAQLNVSRVTVRRAIDDLVKEGLFTQRQGAGTFVTDRIQQPLNYLKSYTEVMAERGQVAGSKWLDRSLGLATEEEQKALKLTEADEVVRLYRLRTADGQPMALELASLPRKFLDNPFAISASLYQTLAENGFRPVKALQKIRATSIDAKRAELLNIEVNSAVLYIERLGLLKDGTPMEFTRSYFPGDSYDFVAEIRNPGSEDE